MNLRVVGWATIHQRMLGSCSTFNVMFDQCTRLHQLNVGFHAYIFVPKSQQYYRIAKRFGECPGVTLLPYYPDVKYKWRTIVDNDVIHSIHPQHTEIPYDLVWTADTTMSSVFSASLMRRQGAWFFPIDIPVVAGLDEDLDETGMTMYEEGTDVGRLAAMTGLSLADNPFVITHHQVDDVKRVATELLSTSRARRLVNRLKMFHSPTKLDHIYKRFGDYENQREARKIKGEPITIFHQGTFEGKRHLPEICKALDDLATLRKDQFRFLKLSPTKGKLTTKVMSTELRVGQTREQFHDALGEGDIVLITSDRNCVGVGYCECIMSGMIPIATNTRWVKERMPEGYPLIINDISKELMPAILYINKNWKKMTEWAAKARETWKEWDVDVAAPKFGDYLSDIAEANRKKCVPALLKHPSGWMIREAIEKLPDEFRGFYKLKEEAVKIAAKTGITLQQWPNIALRWMLLENGYIDEGLELPVFRRVR